MGIVPKYDNPTPTFPYKIRRRVNILSNPRRTTYDPIEQMPAYTDRGIRMSALRGLASDRVNEMAWPWIRRLRGIQRMYKNRFSPERLERIERMIELANSTMYSKLANCVVDLKKDAHRDTRNRKRGWSETEWKKHMEYISAVAAPRRQFEPPPIKRGQTKPLDDLMPRINEISTAADFKRYRRMSQEAWYRNPEKVAPSALKYELTDRTKKLSAPRVYQTQF